MITKKNIYGNIYILDVPNKYWGHCFLSYCIVCKKEMKQIPVRKLDSLYIVEEYCPCCGESMLRYEKIQVI